MTSKTSTLLLSLFLLLLSCSGGNLFHVLTTRPPGDDPPSAELFAEELMIRLTWKADPDAESFTLYRSGLPSGGTWQELYSGEECSFEDRNVSDGRFYYYRLVRCADGSEYPARGISWGAAAGLRRDSSEPNDSLTESVPMTEEMLGANVWFVRDGLGNEAEDVDWYRIRVRGGHTVTLLFDNFINLSPDDLLFTVAGELPVPPVAQVRLVNYDAELREIPFSVRIDSERLFPDPSLSVFLTGQYRIRFVSETSNP